MMVLKRKVGESIMIGNNIKITVTEVRGDKVRIGIAAPDDIPVNRAEVQAQIELGANGQDLSTMSETERRAAHVRGIQKEIDNER